MVMGRWKARAAPGRARPRRKEAVVVRIVA